MKNPRIEGKFFHSTTKQLKCIESFRFRIYAEKNIKISASEIIRDAIDEFLDNHKSDVDLVNYLASKGLLK